MTAPEGPRIRVERTRFAIANIPAGAWIVRCDLCAGPGDFLSFFAAVMPKAWSSDRLLALNYAQAHAARHAATTCPTCKHTPAEPINDNPGAAA